jgi:hypothetical protein
MQSLSSTRMMAGKNKRLNLSLLRSLNLSLRLKLRLRRSTS